MAYSNHSETSLIISRLWKFLRKFTLHYSDLAKPVTDLTKKDRKFEWTKDCQQAFYNLKKQFMEEPVLQMPNHS